MCFIHPYGAMNSSVMCFEHSDEALELVLTAWHRVMDEVEVPHEHRAE